MYQFTKEEQNDLKQIQATYYMKPILKNFHDLVEKKQATWLTCLNKIYEVLKHSETEVRKLLQKRQSKGR